MATLVMGEPMRLVRYLNVLFGLGVAPRLGCWAAPPQLRHSRAHFWAWPLLPWLYLGARSESVTAYGSALCVDPG